MENSWPGGRRHAMSQDQHGKWNSTHYPGTLQLCSDCGDPTTFCEEDGYFDDDMQPYCFECALTHGLRGEWGDDKQLQIITRRLPIVATRCA